MNTKLRIAVIAGFATVALAAAAQNPPTDPADSSKAPPADPAPTQEKAAPAPAPTPTPAQPGDATPAPAPGNAAKPAAEDPAGANAPLLAQTDAPATNAPVGTPAPEGVVTNAASTNGAPIGTAGATVIPLIVMDDVPLTDAIKNLARQAGLNYMLDPKIAFGQPGPDGRPIPQPSVSIRWENITAEQALNALLNNHSLQLVDDPKTKIWRVTTRDPAAPDPLVTQIIQLKFASPSNILSSVQATFSDRRSKVMADTRTSQLVVVATEKEMVAVNTLVERLDAQTKQVLIESRLIETALNPETIKGINWSGTLEAQNLSFGNNLQTTPVQSGESVNAPLATRWPKMMFDTAKGFNPATAFLDMDGVNAVLSFINKDADSKVLSAPRTVTLDNELSSIAVTTAQPIFKNTAGTQGSPGGSEVTYTNLGVILNVTPRISANNFVNLHVIPEVSRVGRQSQKVVANTVNQADTYDIRKIDTHVMIPSGNTLVLGGLVQDGINNDMTKVPILGDMPLLGGLFRSSDKKRSKANMLIFITPTIVQDSDFQPTKSTFLEHALPTEDSVDGDWSVWDTGKPVDWSKPLGPQIDPKKYANNPAE